MITTANYQEKTKSIDFESLDPILTETHQKMEKYLQLYNQSPMIKEMVDLFLAKLNHFIEKQPAKQKKSDGHIDPTKFKIGDWVKSSDHVDPGKIIENKYQGELKKMVFKVEWLDGEISSEIADNLTKTVAKKPKKTSINRVKKEKAKGKEVSS